MAWVWMTITAMGARMDRKRIVTRGFRLVLGDEVILLIEKVLTGRGDLLSCKEMSGLKGDGFVWWECLVVCFLKGW